MPELPEVEYAASIVRRAAVGRTITRVDVLHPSQRRSLPDDAARSVIGDTVVDVERRGKHQLLRLASGRALHVHFRMTGDWQVVAAPAIILPRHARVAIRLDDGSCLVLDDPRALSVVALVARGVDPFRTLGPEATDRAFNAPGLQRQLTRRRGPIKAVLLDQRLVAGVGNIYASEALWYARIDPRVGADRLDVSQLARVVAGVKRALRRALAGAGRAYGEGAGDRRRFNVYDRAGLPCRRCGAPIRRIVQAGRSTYFCRKCQKR